ncbi:CDP-diacylglycerol--glycerol-3-phosphate 3-phosphatidyltransferase [Sphaerochaeta halotolerans]|jgi:CDP-diacylglycerol--glycerol-3-phosphate 3-phosphatidyltransferase|uniref:CDP-diacylglycerol--glycerol-3-phosphate 3-phosphatidyltransferase n=1 Tax=Sphaerochaeta halotolerans TaxID=2293840 RepID=A0A372MFG4_9SPIR|nr:CDP-diacylglycerol--glycerol-3-phosphate 3-phosphatidyltransferase [Sphaerochaeta halotolerans]MBG0767503.1 CDP-diacylglycerol--glycerol-3-phosphate 3-phosphatidyltransferase [Spirochaetaceae bacterium]MDK2859434.1 CDP-diacylglycerol---glycerol-3-phosphate 3-phosphatidyltransferase [Sphaerochaeta sp.]MDN5333944.1 CDP-diacylglycerol---glycerol-3-phosphate 3-phosphatidyltransferase [Sphaerochaeta sp.]MXI87290.1 CDP-diacylglycerol--glycerol-3-phosphate 3-phosphatidyltransferase [Sphaerochaeta h
MNIPNKLTVSRLIMAPLFFIAFHLGSWFGPSFQDAASILTLVLWALTELTDLLDGQIARSKNLVTDLGKVMDPFADTFSRLTYFVCLSGAGIMPLWTFILIMWREFSILFVRMLMMGKGKPVAANIWGKSKAVLYAVSGALGILYIALGNWIGDSSFVQALRPVVTGVFVLAAIAAVMSFLTYIRAIIRDGTLSSMSR